MQNQLAQPLTAAGVAMTLAALFPGLLDTQLPRGAGSDGRAGPLPSERERII
jgi:hypothetical protein